MNNKTVFNEWYDKGRLLSYNAFLHFLIGPRGNGKTFAMKEWAIKDFINNGNKFIWLRRYGTEIDGEQGAPGVKDTFINDIYHKFPDVDFEIKGREIYINSELAGIFVPLTGADKMKSGSFLDYNKIIFDEFIIEPKPGNVYLNGSNEPAILLGFIDTINRLRADDNLKVVCVANAIEFGNPYFLHFKVPPFDITKNRFWHDPYRGIVTEFSGNNAYREARRATRFGRLIKDTSYETYAIDSMFSDMSEELLAATPHNARFICNIQFEKFYVSFYESPNEGDYTVYTKFEKRIEENRAFVLIGEDMSENVLLINRGSLLTNMLKVSYAKGLMKFEDQMVRTMVHSIFKKL